MNCYNNAVRIGLWVIACIFLVVYFFDDLSSVSIDMAHHYALIARLGEFWQIPADHFYRDALGEMEIYPKLSHALAALFGIVLNSSLMGMQLVVLLAFIVLWSSIGFALQTLPKRVFVLAATLFIGLLFLNHFYLALELFGSEVIGNYFFAQLVAQAIVVVTIFATMFAEQKDAIPPRVRYLLVGVMVMVVEMAHLLPALELFVFLMFLVIVDGCCLLQKNCKIFLGRGLFLAILLTAIILHPTYNAMKLISLTNGGLLLNYIHDRFSLTILAVLVAILSVLMLFLWRKFLSRDKKNSYLLLKYVALFGLTLSGLCILQMLLTLLGYGSEYACRKYAFGLNTILLLDIALLPVICWEWFSKAAETLSQGFWYQPFSLFFPVIFIVTVFFTVLSNTKLVSLNSIVQIERVIVPYYGLEVEKRLPDQYDDAIGLKGGWGIDNLVTLGMLSGVREMPLLEMLDLGYERQLDTNKIRDIVVKEDIPFWNIPECRRHIFPNGIVILDGKCIFSRIKLDARGRFLTIGNPDHPLHTWIQYGIAGTGKNYLVPGGWSTPEADSTWTDGEKATLNFHVNATTKLRMTLRLYPFLTQKHNMLTIQPTVNGQRLPDWVIDNPAPRQYELLLGPAVDGNYVIVFNIKTPGSPYDAGINGDRRQLGISLISTKIEVMGN